MKLYRILRTTVALGIVGGVIFSSLGLSRSFGVRKINDLYSFNYCGKPAVVRHEDIKLGPDKIYFLIDGKDELKGTLTSDDGKKITVYGDVVIFGSSVRDGYFIRDNK